MDRVRVRPRLRRVPPARRPVCGCVRSQARARVGPRRADDRLRARRRRRRRHARDRCPLRQGRKRRVHCSGRTLAPHDFVRGRPPPQQGARRLHGGGSVRIHVWSRLGRIADPGELATHLRGRRSGRRRLAACDNPGRTSRGVWRRTGTSSRHRRRPDGHRRVAPLRLRGRRDADGRLVVARDDPESDAHGRSRRRICRHRANARSAARPSRASSLRPARPCERRSAPSLRLRDGLQRRQHALRAECARLGTFEDGHRVHGREHHHRAPRPARRCHRHPFRRNVGSSSPAPSRCSVPT